MSGTAQKPPDIAADRSKGKGGAGGFWRVLAKLFDAVSIPSSTHPPSHDPKARMEPVRHDRTQTYEEAIYRKTEGAAGIAPAKRLDAERAEVARSLVGRAGGGAAADETPAPTNSNKPPTISAQPAAVAFKVFRAEKKSQADLTADCIKQNLHGKEVKTKGGDPPAVAAAKAQEEIRALKERIASVEKKLNDPQLVAQERLARARGVPQAEIDKIQVKGRASIGKLRGQLEGIKGELKGVEGEEAAAAKVKPDLRNIHILCKNCNGEITEIDMLKGNVAYEVKAAASLVDVDKMLLKQDAVEKLWDGEVQVAVAESDDALKVITKKFESKGEKPPKVTQF